MNVTDAEVQALESPGFFVRDHVLGEASASAARDDAWRLASSSELHRAGVSRGATQDPSVRNDQILWIDRAMATPPLLPLLDLFDSLRSSLNQSAYLGLSRYDLQLALYPGGGARYVRHRDSFTGTGTNRRLTAIYYLNAQWRPEHGGALRLFPEGAAPTDVDPVLDRLVVFLSDRLDHEVLPVHAPRLALTAWYYGAGA